MENWPAIIDTTLDIETLVYPAGWTPSGVAKRSHHNNYDVATIFALGWPHMTDEQKVMVRERIRRLLAWCLGEIAEKHGFNDEPDTAAADTYYYGARFLDRLGFWDPQRRFWSRSAPDLPDWITSPGALAGLLLTLTALNDHTAETATATAILQTAKYTQTNAPPPDDGA